MKVVQTGVIHGGRSNTEQPMIQKGSFACLCNIFKFHFILSSITLSKITALTSDTKVNRAEWLHKLSKLVQLINCNWIYSEPTLQMLWHPEMSVSSIITCRHLPVSSPVDVPVWECLHSQYGGTNRRNETKMKMITRHSQLLPEI